MHFRLAVFRALLLSVIVGLFVVFYPVASVNAARGGNDKSNDARSLFEGLNDEQLFDFGATKSLFPDLEEGIEDEEPGRTMTAAERRRKAKEAARKRADARRKSSSQGSISESREEDHPDLTGKPLNAEGAKDGNLSWDQADLLVVLKGISELTGMNFIISPQVRASNITILTSKQIKKKDLPRILQSILEVNGLAAIKSGDYYKIVPQAESITYNMETGFGADLETIPGDDRMITQVIPVENLSVKDISGVVTPLLSKSGKLLTHEGTNTLIICSTASNIKRILQIIHQLDVPGFSSDEKLYVYYVENGEAVNIANTINALFSERDSQLLAARRRAILSSRRNRDSDESGNKTSVNDYTSSTVVADENINAIIIKATPSQYEVLLSTIRKLDIPPKQVLIEVLIAEITLDDQTELGFEWQFGSTNQVDFGGRQHTVSQSTSNNLGLGMVGADSVASVLSGFNFMLSETNQFVGYLNAKASQSKLDVLASPHIIATDNEEASIAITDEVPVEQRDITDSGNIFVSYQYRDAGIKLTVTPHINEKGVIALELDQEVSEISSPPSATTQPTFRKREANTTVRLFDNQTLVIGGLFQKTTTSGYTGIPILSELPLIGFLFRSNTELTRKTELVIMLTPHLVDTMEKGDAITEKIKNRMKGSFEDGEADSLSLGRLPEPDSTDFEDDGSGEVKIIDQDGDQYKITIESTGKTDSGDGGTD